MTNLQFLYWLQGYFELRGTRDPLTCEQAHTIIRHGEMVHIYCEERSESIDPGVISVCAMAAQIEKNSDLAGPLTGVMEEILSARFLHVVDPTAGGPKTQAKLNTAHNAKTGPAFCPATTLVRC